MGWARDPPNGMNAIAGGTRGLQSKLAFKIAAGGKGKREEGTGQGGQKKAAHNSARVAPGTGKKCQPPRIKKRSAGQDRARSVQIWHWEGLTRSGASEPQPYGRMANVSARTGSGRATAARGPSPARAL
ncbi:unnamed protein product [Ixodes pacificus]